MTSLSEDDIVFAGEFVLGLLDAASEATAQARLATDAVFAAEVDAWRERLAPILFGDEVAPAHIWDAVQNSLPASTGQDVGAGKLWVWRTLTGVAVSAAAILGILLMQKPDPVSPPAPVAPLIAALGSETGPAALTANYDSSTGRMIVTPVSLETGELYPELWVIPADGTPRSLGIVSSTGAVSLAVAADLRQYIDAGSTLAITPEPETGGPGGKPSGPILASGKVTTL